MSRCRPGILQLKPFLPQLSFFRTKEQKYVLFTWKCGYFLTSLSKPVCHNSRLEKDVPLGFGDSSVIAAVVHPVIILLHITTDTQVCLFKTSAKKAHLCCLAEIWAFSMSCTCVIIYFLPPITLQQRWTQRGS